MKEDNSTTTTHTIGKPSFTYAMKHTFHEDLEEGLKDPEFAEAFYKSRKEAEREFNIKKKDNSTHTNDSITESHDSVTDELETDTN